MEYLPIGSVVLLKGATKKIMITGFYVKPNKNDKKIYDYSGCLYPEGLLTGREMLVFNKDQIQEVFHKGYESDEEKHFKEKLYQVIEKDKTGGNNG